MHDEILVWENVPILGTYVLVSLKTGKPTVWVSTQCDKKFISPKVAPAPMWHIVPWNILQNYSLYMSVITVIAIKGDLLPSAL